MRNAWVPLLIVAGYVVGGRLGLQLALPPGYATAIFPPAGIAVAAAFIVGRSTTPWIFLGSFLLNLWVAYAAHQEISHAALVAASIIAAASMLQAYVGGDWLRRAIGFPCAFDRLRHLLRFILLTPVFCLVSATLSVMGLWLLGMVQTGELAANWFSWWMGDVLGVLVVLPIVMTLVGQPRALWKSRRYSVATPMLLAFAVFVVLFFKTNHWEQDSALTEFRQLSQQCKEQIQSRLDEQEAVLAGMRGLFMHDANGSVSRQEFQRFTQGMLARFSMIQAFEWAPNITASERSAFERAQHRDFPVFEIKERDASGHLIRAHARTNYFPIEYVEPYAGNEAALGFDLASSDKRGETIFRANRQGRAVASAPVVLVQAQGQVGVLVMQSVTLNGRQSGVVLTVLKMREFIDRILPFAQDKLYLRLWDEDAQQLLYDNGVPNNAEPQFETRFEFGTRHYRLQTVPTQDYLVRHHGWESWGVLVMGTFGTGMLGALLLLGTGYTARVLALVDERTRELQDSESRFRNTMEHAPIGMCTTDVEGRFMMVNQAYCNMLGYGRDELEGTYFADITFPDDRLLASPYREKMLRGEIDTYQAQKRYVRKDGKTLWVQLTSSIVRNAFGAPPYFVAQVEDISERKRLEEQLKRQAHVDFLTGLNNRGYFMELAEMELSRAIRYDKPLSLLMLDIDLFKLINDTRGHKAGDLVLKKLADVCRQTLREVDIMGRMGGEEFAIMLPETGMDRASEVAERLRGALAASNVPVENGIPITYTVSIGVTSLASKEDNMDALLSRADQGLYQAKGAGRNRVCLKRH